MSEKKSKDTKKLLILIGVIVAIFVLFVAGFRLTVYLRGPTAMVVTIDEMHKLNLEGKGGEGNYVYNGFSFIYSNGAWYTQAQRGDTLYDIPLHFGPRDVEDISVKGSIDPNFGNKRIIYVSFDPTDPHIGLAAIELSLNLGKGIEVATKAACDKDYDIDACKERSVVTCEDKDKSVILIKQANETKVTLDEKCIVIEGKDKELMRATDNVILRFYGVLKS
ncbi:hypothetical protein KY342_05240 [Candidatus Woesearchaeota archaeon]|nr:hypothetical protein [Candidatus Woesearchaeota archaeon]